MKRKFTKVDAPHRHRVSHYLGFPPKDGDSSDERRPMRSADFLILERRENDAMLFRFTADGGFAGDTWHFNEEEALEQAEYEFPGSLSVWMDVPDGVSDSVSYAKKQLFGEPER